MPAQAADACYDGTAAFPDGGTSGKAIGSPFTTRRFDRATNLWPLALLSFGESWHNMHHSDPACPRHGVDQGQIDVSAAVIRVFERLGWATDVHWPTSARLDSHRRSNDAAGTEPAQPELAMAPAGR